MTKALRCTGLRKRYLDQGDYALGPTSEGVTIEVTEGELFALVGPSGCGKTTTLRIIGGFLAPSQGTVEINGKDVTRLRPHERPANTVFQGYALFPHMTVAANVEFGLKMENVPKPERQRRTQEALELVGLERFGSRRVSELSGGQAQRTALARAIVKQPAVLLLDEPLGALDLKLRKQMQEEIVRLKERTKTTFVHVTHDQDEACAIADRIAVMSAGEVVQVDTPQALFQQPRTTYVAEFIDAGTVLRGTSRRQGDIIEVATGDVVIRGPAPGWLNGSSDAAAVLAPGRLNLAPLEEGSGAVGGDTANRARGEIERVVFTSSMYEVHVRISADSGLRVGVPIASAGGPPMEALQVGNQAEVSWRPEDVIFVRDAE